MRVLILFGVLAMLAMPACAEIASTSYVASASASKVDTSVSANQTMAGSYTVSGTLVVPTPPLPSAE